MAQLSFQAAVGARGGRRFIMTECSQSSFRFEAFGSREIVARFDAGVISSDGGALLMRRTDKRLNLLPRLAKWVIDARRADLKPEAAGIHSPIAVRKSATARPKAGHSRSGRRSAIDRPSSVDYRL